MNFHGGLHHADTALWYAIMRATETQRGETRHKSAKDKVKNSQRHHLAVDCAERVTGQSDFVFYVRGGWRHSRKAITPGQAVQDYAHTNYASKMFLMAENPKTDYGTSSLVGRASRKTIKNDWVPAERREVVTSMRNSYNIRALLEEVEKVTHVAISGRPQYASKMHTSQYWLASMDLAAYYNNEDDNVCVAYITCLFAYADILYALVTWFKPGALWDDTFPTLVEYIGVRGRAIACNDLIRPVHVVSMQDSLVWNKHYIR
jgi:hypothetical protein